MKRRVESCGSGDDRISSLPDDLLYRILLNLCTKITIRTSVLSKRWKSLWLSVPSLDLRNTEFLGENSLQRFVTFVDRFLDNSKELLIKLKLHVVGMNNICYLVPFLPRWIEYAISRKVKHLDINCSNDYFDVKIPIPSSVYTCSTLVFLKLHFMSLPDFEDFSLPNLKTLHLEVIHYDNDAFLQKLISSCPVLEDLRVYRCARFENSVKVLRVCSQSLKNLKLVQGGDEEWCREEDTHGWEVAVDASALDYLSLEDAQLSSFMVHGLCSPRKVSIDVNFGFDLSSSGLSASERSMVRKFFTTLSSVRDMTMSGRTLEILCHYMEYELLQFPYVTRFDAVLYNSDLEKLPVLLKGYLNLKSLVLDIVEFTEKEQLIISSSTIPECLRSTLEYVEIEAPISEVGEELKLVKYFLENSAVLKELKLTLKCKTVYEEGVILAELLKLTRCSPSCQVVVLGVERNYPTTRNFL